MHAAAVRQRMPARLAEAAHLARGLWASRRADRGAGRLALLRLEDLAIQAARVGWLRGALAEERQWAVLTAEEPLGALLGVGLSAALQAVLLGVLLAGRQLRLLVVALLGVLLAVLLVALPGVLRAARALVVHLLAGDL